MFARPFGDRAIVVTGIDQPLPVMEALRTHFPEATVRPGMDAVLIEFDAPRADLMVLAQRIGELVLVVPEMSPTSTRRQEVTVRYDGVDLDSVARELGMQPLELIRSHQDTVWQVAMIGFAPGFPYLVPVGEQGWQIPRLATPRARVPSGSVAVAAGMCAIYPTGMPGGWHLIGTTDLRLFDVNADPPSLLAAGDIVRFREAP